MPRKTLEVMKANGLRLLLVGYESGNQKILHNIKKGLLVDVAQAFRRGLPRARHHRARHLHSGPAGRDARDHPGDAGSSPRKSTRARCRCHWRRPIRAPSSTSRPRRTAGSPPTSTSHRRRHADRAAQLSASRPHRNFRFGRGILQEVLFPPLQDRRDRRRDADLAATCWCAACARAWNSSTSCARGAKPRTRALSVLAK